MMPSCSTHGCAGILTVIRAIFREYHIRMSFGKIETASYGIDVRVTDHVIRIDTLGGAETRCRLPHSDQSDR